MFIQGSTSTMIQPGDGPQARRLGQVIIMTEEPAEIKTAADVRMDRLEAMLKKLEEENLQLRAANQSLYAAASPEESKSTAESPTAGKIVGEQEAAAKARKDFDNKLDKSYRLARVKMGFKEDDKSSYPEKQKDGM